MILLAGVLIVIAFFLYSTQATLINSIGQEAGREAANPVLSDYQGIRSGISTQLRYEIRDQYSIPRCPTDEADYAGRVQAHLVLVAKLESNRGQLFSGTFIDAVIPVTNVVGADPPRELQTKIKLYLTNGRSTIQDTVTFVTACWP